MNDENELFENRAAAPAAEENGEELVFYYSRERRLAKAPKRVREFYENPPAKKRFAFFTCLVDTRPKALSLISIVILCIAIFVLKHLR